MAGTSKAALISIYLLEYVICGERRNDICKSTMHGTEYTGTINTTVCGLTCQRWDSQTPHKHNRNDRWRYLLAPTADDANFCRNPDFSKGPWCYTMNPKVRWEYCPVPDCDLPVPMDSGKHEGYECERVTHMVNSVDAAFTETTEHISSEKGLESPSRVPQYDDGRTNHPTQMIDGRMNATEVASLFTSGRDDPRKSNVKEPRVVKNNTSLDGPLKITTPFMLTRDLSYQVEEDNQSLALSEDDVEEAPGAVYIGSFGLIMAVVFVSFLVILDLTTYYDNLRYLFENLQDFLARRKIYV